MTAQSVTPEPSPTMSEEERKAHVTRIARFIGRQEGSGNEYGYTVLLLVSTGHTFEEAARHINKDPCFKGFKHPHEIRSEYTKIYNKLGLPHSYPLNPDMLDIIRGACAVVEEGRPLPTPPEAKAKAPTLSDELVVKAPLRPQSTPWPQPTRPSATASPKAPEPVAARPVFSAPKPAAVVARPEPVPARIPTEEVAPAAPAVAAPEVVSEPHTPEAEPAAIVHVVVTDPVPAVEVQPPKRAVRAQRKPVARTKAQVEPEHVSVETPPPQVVQAKADDDAGVVFYIAKRLRQVSERMLARVKMAVVEGHFVDNVFNDISHVHLEEGGPERKRSILTRALHQAYPATAAT